MAIRDVHAQYRAKLTVAKPVAFPVVGIGASAGGLDAFAEMLTGLPPRTGMAFVLVQHLDPTHESILVEILARKSVLPVSQVTDGMVLEPNHVYVNPPNARMEIDGGLLRLTARAGPGHKHMPIDHFFKSLAAYGKGSAIGVVLSGTAKDGTFGLKAIKAEGGTCFAQDEESAKFPGMPASAKAAGCVDYVLPPRKIAAELVQIASQLSTRPPDSAPSDILPAGSEGEVRKLLLLIRSATGVDFSHYKSTTVHRRIAKRMLQKKISNVGELVESLQGNSDEVEALYQDLLIHVTSFFREPDAFLALKSSILPRLLAGDIAVTGLRVWVPGCSSGEEAYSIAIAVTEHLGDRLGKVRVQIFATDLSEPLIERARAGVYPGTSLAQVSPERLAKFFVKAAGGYRVTEPIRDMCVFARQDLTQDPPFSHIDLISCRNVLIHLDPVLQRKILAAFHYALNDSGILLLGKSESESESLNAFPHLFTPPEQGKFFRKRAASNLQVRRAAIHPSRSVPTGKPAKPTPWAADLRSEADQIVWSRYGHAGIIVNENLQIIHFRGDTSQYLAPAAGTASLNILKMVKRELLVDLRAAFHQVKRHNISARKDIALQIGNRTVRVCLDVIPLASIDTPERHFLVLIEETRSRPVKTAVTSKGGITAIVKLQKELKATTEYLQAVIEEQETTNDELKAANDDVLSNNEELQSINEELETATEQLQSTNKELATLTDLQSAHNSQLKHVNDDLSNVLNGLQMPILLLGNDLRIRRFTPRAQEAFNMLPADIGRPIHNIKPNLDLLDLQSLISSAIETHAPQDHEVRDLNGHYYAMNVRPYVTSDNKIEGALIALVDTDKIKRTLQKAERTRDYASAIVDTVRQPLVVLDTGLRVVTANRSFCECFQVSREEVENREIFDLCGGGWASPDLRELLEKILIENSRFENLKLVHTFPRVGRRILLLNARRLAWEAETSGLILLAMEDITERESITADLRDSRERLRDLTASLLTAQDEERRRISRELHDDLDQKVAMLIVEMEMLEKAPPRTSAKSIRNQLSSLRAQTESICDDLRDTAHRLHTSVVDNLGLSAALRSLCADFSKQEKMNVHFRQRNVDIPIPPNIGLCLYRITQEALRNVGKHSGARHATVSLLYANGRILLSIHDTGAGFDLAMIGAKKGLGIVSMEERVRLVGGTMTIRSASGRGMRVMVEVALAGAKS